MFSQIGGKLKKLAVVLLILIAGGSIWGALDFMQNGSNGIALFLFFFAVFGSWTISSLVYGMGEKIEIEESNTRVLMEILDELRDGKVKKSRFEEDN